MLRFSGIWAAHFLLWTFSDMLTLLQELTSPAPDSILLFAAAPLAIAQAALILLPLFLKLKTVRILNFIFVPIYLAFNIINFTEVSAGWEYLLTTAFVALNFLCFIVALKAGTGQQE